MLEDYLISENGTNLLSQRKKPLTEKDRKRLIRHIYEYVISRFGAYPTKEQKEALSQAVVFLFPSLKSNRGETGTVS